MSAEPTQAEFLETLDVVAGSLHAIALLKLADSPLVSDRTKKSAADLAQQILAID